MSDRKKLIMNEDKKTQPQQADIQILHLVRMTDGERIGTFLYVPFSCCSVSCMQSLR